jgi:hypothetical protein
MLNNYYRFVGERIVQNEKAVIAHRLPAYLNAG